MVGLHIAAGAILIVLNGAAFALGGIAWLRKQASIPFWYLLRAAQVSVFVQALIGGLLVERAAAADLVVTGEGSFDFSSRSGKVPYGVAELSAEAVRPCIALAGKVLVGSREMRALGVESAYATVDLVGEERSFADPAGSLAALAERVARSWSR